MLIVPRFRLVDTEPFGGNLDSDVYILNQCEEFFIVDALALYDALTIPEGRTEYAEFDSATHMIHSRTPRPCSLRRCVPLSEPCTVISRLQLVFGNGLYISSHERNYSIIGIKIVLQILLHVDNLGH